MPNHLQLGMGAVFVTALFFANLPFLSNRLMGLAPRIHKSLGLRLLEWLVGYGVSLGCGIVVEMGLGERYPQDWPYYVVTFCLFLIFAYPGFIYCYLWRRKSDGYQI